MTEEKKLLKKEIEAITDPIVIAKIGRFIDELTGEPKSENRLLCEKSAIAEFVPKPLAEECEVIVIRVSDGEPLACFKKHEDAEIFLNLKMYDMEEYQIVGIEEIKEIKKRKA